MAGKPTYLARLLQALANRTFDALVNDLHPGSFTEELIRQLVRHHATLHNDPLLGSERRIDSFTHSALRKAERSHYVRQEDGGYVLSDEVKEPLSEIAVQTDIHHHSADAYRRFTAKVMRRFPGKRVPTKAEIQAELDEAEANLRTVTAQLEEALEALTELERAEKVAGKRAVRVGPPMASPEAVAGPSNSSHTLDAESASPPPARSSFSRDSLNTPQKQGPSSNPNTGLPTPPDSNRRQPSIVNPPPSPTTPLGRHSSQATAFEPPESDAMDVDDDGALQQPQFGVHVHVDGEGEDLRTRVEAGSAELAVAKLALVETQAALGEVRVALEAARMRVRELEDAREAETAELEGLKATCAEQQEQLGVADVRREQGGAALARLEHFEIRNGELRVEVGDLQAQNGDLRAQNEGLLTRNRGLREEVDGLQAQVVGLREENGACRTENVRLRANVGSLETRLADAWTMFSGFAANFTPVLSVPSFLGRNP